MSNKLYLITYAEGYDCWLLGVYSTKELAFKHLLESIQSRWEYIIVGWGGLWTPPPTIDEITLSDRPNMGFPVGITRDGKRRDAKHNYYEIAPDTNIKELLYME